MLCSSFLSPYKIVASRYHSTWNKQVWISTSFGGKTNEVSKVQWLCHAAELGIDLQVGLVIKCMHWMCRNPPVPKGSWAISPASWSAIKQGNFMGLWKEWECWRNWCFQGFFFPPVTRKSRDETTGICMWSNWVVCKRNCRVWEGKEEGKRGNVFQGSFILLYYLTHSDHAFLSALFTPCSFWALWCYTSVARNCTWLLWSSPWRWAGLTCCTTPVASSRWAFTLSWLPRLVQWVGDEASRVIRLGHCCQQPYFQERSCHIYIRDATGKSHITLHITTALGHYFLNEIIRFYVEKSPVPHPCIL